VPDRFGPGLPAIREWTEAHDRCSAAYVPELEPEEADRAAPRREPGFGADEVMAVAAVGGPPVAVRCCDGWSTPSRRPASASRGWA